MGTVGGENNKNKEDEEDYHGTGVGKDLGSNTGERNRQKLNERSNETIQSGSGSKELVRNSEVFSWYLFILKMLCWNVGGIGCKGECEFY